MARYSLERCMLLTPQRPAVPQAPPVVNVSSYRSIPSPQVNTPEDEMEEDEMEEECPTPEKMEKWLRKHPRCDVARLREYREAGFDFQATFGHIINETFLGLAAEYCALPIMKFLVEECGLDVNHRSGVWYPMHHAVSERDKEKIEYLLSKGARLNVYAPDGHGCGLSALRNPEFLRYLCEKGLYVRGCGNNYDGETLAMHALLYGDTECLEVLHEYGAHIEHYFVDDENLIKYMDCEEDQNLLMRCLFERVARGEKLKLKNEYPWKQIRSELLRQVVSWVCGRHVLYDMFSSEDVAGHIASYLFFPHKRILEFLAQKIGVPPCADYCYIREAIEDGTFFKKCISCGSEDVDDRWVPKCASFCEACEKKWVTKNELTCNGYCDHVNPWKCEDCNDDDAGCYICDHRDDSIAVFEFYQGMQTLSREEMCERFQLKMKCDDCRKSHCCSYCNHEEWEGISSPCECSCHE